VEELTIQYRCKGDLPLSTCIPLTVGADGDKFYVLSPRMRLCHKLQAKPVDTYLLAERLAQLSSEEPDLPEDLIPAVSKAARALQKCTPAFLEGLDATVALLAPLIGIDLIRKEGLQALYCDVERQTSPPASYRELRKWFRRFVNYRIGFLLDEVKAEVDASDEDIVSRVLEEEEDEIFEKVWDEANCSLLSATAERFDTPKLGRYVRKAVNDAIAAAVRDTVAPRIRFWIGAETLKGWNGQILQRSMIRSLRKKATSRRRSVKELASEACVSVSALYEAGRE
jgi:hypothetical protein